MDYEMLGAALAVLDLTPEADEISRLHGVHAEADAAIEHGQQRMREIDSELARQKRDGEDGTAAARALLAGNSVAGLPTSAESLLAERGTLLAGLGTLRRNMQEAYDDIKSAQGRAAGRLAPIADVIAASLKTEAYTLIDRLLEIYAEALALEETLSNGAAGELRARLKNGLRALVMDCSRNSQAEVQPELVAIFDANRDKLAVARVFVRRSVSI